MHDVNRRDISVERRYDSERRRSDDESVTGSQSSNATQAKSVTKENAKIVMRTIDVTETLLIRRDEHDRRSD